MKLFFPERIKSIKNGDKVLEIGPGATPYYRSDVFLELKFDSDEKRIEQSGYVGILKTDKPIVYYDGLKFPFDDNEFDYVICSHVLEHVPIQNIDLFISELKRVAKKGYIEAPSVFYDYIFNHKVHKLLIFSQNNCLRILGKDQLNFGLINDFLWLVQKYGDSKSTNKFINRNKNLFFWGFEWHENIMYNVVNDIDELLSESDLSEFKKYLISSSKNHLGNCGLKSNFIRLKMKCKNILRLFD